MSRPNSIAVIANREGQDSQGLLSRTAAGWREAGVKVAGMLAEDNDVEGVCSAGFLSDIASGRRFSIHLDVPPPGTTCHLDAAGVEDACAVLIDQVRLADVVILSKFGKLETTRQGLWKAFSAAAVAGKPLLTTVSARHADAWKAFAPDAVWLEADGPSIERWRDSVRSTGAA